MAALIGRSWCPRSRLGAKQPLCRLTTLSAVTPNEHASSHSPSSREVTRGQWSPQEDRYPSRKSSRNYSEQNFRRAGGRKFENDNSRYGSGRPPTNSPPYKNYQRNEGYSDDQRPNFGREYGMGDDAGYMESDEGREFNRGNRGGRFDRHRERYWERDEARDTHLKRLKDGWQGEALYGVAPVLAALQAKRRDVHKLYIQEKLQLNKRKDAGAISKAVKLAADCGIEVEHLPKHALNVLAGSTRPHQGFVLDCGHLDYTPMAAFPEIDTSTIKAPPPVWLALDEVMDPHNLGAVIRTSYFLGVAGIVVSAKNSAPLSPAVSKVSSGVLEVMPIHSCVKMPHFLTNAQEKGWTVVGASAGEGSVPCTDLTTQGPVILVVGNEGYGLRTNVERACSTLVRVDDFMPQENFVLDSLNVSVATGILLHHVLAGSRKLV